MITVMTINSPKKIMSKNMLAVGQVGTVAFRVCSSLMRGKDSVPSETTSNWLPGFLEMRSRLTKILIDRFAVHDCFKFE